MTYFARIRPAHFLALLALGFCFTSGHARADGPAIDKSTVVISTNRLTNYSGATGKPDYSMWSWKPHIAFTVIGPVSAGSQLIVEFTKPSGVAWISSNVRTDELDAGKTSHIDLDPNSLPDSKGALETGVYGVKIRDKNELESTDTILYTGKFKVNKFHVGLDLPKFKNDFEYYVDNDWRLPIGYLYPDPGDRDESRPLDVEMWCKAPSSTSIQAKPYLYYKGKLVATGGDGTANGGEGATTIQTNEDSSPQCWQQEVFEFNTTAIHVTGTDSSSDYFDLSKNPGEYEVKMLWDGKLARSMKFTVGDDGNIVDPGYSKAVSLGGSYMIEPVSVLGSVDSSWSHDAYKTDAYYGNPIPGFTAP